MVQKDNYVLWGLAWGKCLLNHGSHFLPHWIEPSLDLVWGSLQFKGLKTEEGPRYQVRKQLGCLCPSTATFTAYSGWKEPQTDRSEHGRQGTGAGGRSVCVELQVTAASPSKGPVPWVPHLWKGLSLNFRNVNQVKWLLCLTWGALLASHLS